MKRLKSKQKRELRRRKELAHFTHAIGPVVFQVCVDRLYAHSNIELERHCLAINGLAYRFAPTGVRFVAGALVFEDRAVDPMILSHCWLEDRNGKVIDFAINDPESFGSKPGVRKTYTPPGRIRQNMVTSFGMAAHTLQFASEAPKHLDDLGFKDPTFAGVLESEVRHRLDFQHQEVA